MAKEERKKENEEKRPQINANNSSSERYARDFLALRCAIIENCRDCIRDCGKDCLDGDAKPLENIRCPLQKVRIDYGIAIKGPDPRLQDFRQIKNHKIKLQ